MRIIYDKNTRSFAVSDANLKNALNKLEDPRNMDKDEAIKAVKRFLGNLDYTKYVDRLSDLMKDPKFAAIVKMVGSGKYAENLFKVTQVNIPVAKLMPTQNEIDLDKSLKYGLQGNVKTYFKNPVMIMAPLLTLNGNYIIDGHHRWSQVLCFNPKAKMVCINLESDLGPIATLKSAQLAVAGTQGKVEVQKVEGKSIYNISERELRKYISGISDNAAEELSEYVKSVKDKKSAINYIMNNAMELKSNNIPITHAPKRDFMPQTDAQTPKALDKGSVEL